MLTFLSRAAVAGAALVALWVVWGCTQGDSRTTMLSGPFDSATSSLAPDLQCVGDSIYISWLQEEADSTVGLWYSKWLGSEWGPAFCAASGTRWVANRSDVPRLLPGPHGLTAAWLERIEGSPWAYGVKVGTAALGQKITTSTWLHSDTSECEHGFATLLAWDGETEAVWLDGRETVHDGPTTLRAARITSDGRVENETVLDDRVCDCCPTSALCCADGSVLVAYRDRSSEEVRDIAVTRWKDGAWSAPRTVYRDEWKLDGCPVNGPSLAATDSEVALAWFAMAGGVDPTVQVAFSTNAGESFGAPVRVDKRSPQGRADVTWLADGRALVVWIESHDSTTSLWARAVSRSSKADTALLIADLPAGTSGGMPQVIASGETVIVAWTETGEFMRVRTARLRL